MTIKLQLVPKANLQIKGVLGFPGEKGDTGDPAAAGSVTNTQLAPMMEARIKGRPAGAGDGPVMDLEPIDARSALELGNLATQNLVTTTLIQQKAVTNPRLSDMAAATFKGRAAGAGTGVPTDLTAAQAKAILALTSADLSDFANAAMPQGYITGLTLANNATDATNDIDVAPGAAKDDGNTTALVTAATIVKQIDVEFAEYSAPGTPSGGRASADNLTGSKWFHVYLIGGAGKNTQPFFATSLTPTLPTGFTVKRRIGSIYWGTTIRAFRQVGNLFEWSRPVADINTAVGTSFVLYTLSVPTGVVVRPKLVGFFQKAAVVSYAYIGAPGTGPSSVNSTLGNYTHFTSAASGTAATTAVIGDYLYTNTSAQVQAAASEASVTIVFATIGWEDTRDA